MSNYNHRRPTRDSAASPRQILTKVERELAEGYFEVEITGLTLRRLTAAYSVIFRNAFTHTVDNLRSLLRPTPVH